jgi:hypothetical protein
MSPRAQRSTTKLELARRATRPIRMARRLLTFGPMRTPRVWVVCLTLWGLTVAADARGQENNSFAVGGSFTHRVAPDALAHGDDGVGLKFRLGHADTGWGWQYGLSWYSTNLDRSIGGRTTHLGELKIRPLLGGYGYTQSIGERVSVTGKVFGGFAFTAFRITPEAIDAFYALPAQGVRVDPGMTPIIKPEVTLWYDLNGKFGLGVDVGYIIARPRLTITSSLGRESERIRADAVTISTGLVYRIF